MRFRKVPIGPPVRNNVRWRCLSRGDLATRHRIECSLASIQRVLESVAHFHCWIEGTITYNSGRPTVDFRFRGPDYAVSRARAAIDSITHPSGDFDAIIQFRQWVG